MTSQSGMSIAEGCYLSNEKALVSQNTSRTTWPRYFGHLWSTINELPWCEFRSGRNCARLFSLISIKMEGCSFLNGSILWNVGISWIFHELSGENSPRSNHTKASVVLNANNNERTLHSARQNMLIFLHSNWYQKEIKWEKWALT